jgi:hypothetical protein
LAAEVGKWLSRAAEADAAEDSEHGADRRGDEMPDWMADKQRRLGRDPGRQGGAPPDSPQPLIMDRFVSLRRPAA